MKHLLITAFLLLPMLVFAGKTKFNPKTGKMYEVKTLSKKILPKWKLKKNINYIPVLKNQEFTSAPDGELYLPAEFAKMEAVLIQPGLWDAISIVYYKEMIKGLHDAGVTPYIITKNESEKSDVNTKLLQPLGLTDADVRYLMYEYDAVWTRDYGPWHTYLEGDRVIVDMKYFPDRPLDDNVPILLGSELNEDVYKANLSTEGGNFMSDGFGSCWISQGVEWYNPSLSVTQIKDYYKKFVGCNTVTIVPPLPDEGTTHIDMFSKIINQNTILVGFSTLAYGAEKAEIDQLDTVAEIYRNSPKPDGKKWNIIRIPMTFETYWDDYYKENYRVYYTHTNSLIVNSHVLVPIYKRGTDTVALKIYKDALPEYTITAIDANAFIPYGGAIHCTTMQIPLKQESICGNGIIEEDKAEECEDNYLNEKFCSDYNFSSGKLKCNDCKFDYSDCVLYDAPLSDKQDGVCKDQVKVFSYTSFQWEEPDYTLVEDYEEIESKCDEIDNDCNGEVDESCKDDTSSCSYENTQSNNSIFILFLLFSIIIIRKKFVKV